MAITIGYEGTTRVPPEDFAIAQVAGDQMSH
jgi:hypothetical protein